MKTVIYILSRLAQSIFALLCIVTITFFLARLAPGGPFLEEKAVPAHLMEQMNAKYGFDKSLPVQYALYLGRLVRGDLGPSFGNKGFSVNEVIAEGFPVSLFLGIVGLIIALLIGVPIGVFAAAKRNTATDYGLMTLAMIGVCLPTFVIAPLLGEIFALKLGWFNVALWEDSSAWFLGSMTLGLYYSAYIARLTRGSMLDVLNQDFIRTAHAKGVAPAKVLFKHAFRGGITPVVAYLGPALAGLIGGSFVVETVFGLPGLGQHFIKAATNRDYWLINGTVTVFAVLILFMNFFVDIIQAWLDPRTRSRD
ncbi:ABC transporter permease [Verrucomicrobiales bacterium]|nr:ABC transporter permease [Verrucomicrobiales bacterium]MDB4358841.1 ABC transporter permease [Verrucomicrobiales bacterium]